MSESKPGPGSNVPEALIVFHISELTKVEREEDEAKAVLAAIRAKKKKRRKLVQADGIKLEDFDFSRKLMEMDEDEVRSKFSGVGMILRAAKVPVGFQFDIFGEPDRTPQEDRWRAAGYLAGVRAEVYRTDNPHQRGDKGHGPWDDGYMDAQKAIAAGMEMSSTAKQEDKPAKGRKKKGKAEPEAPAPDPETEPMFDGDTAPADIPQTEDEALKV